MERRPPPAPPRPRSRRLDPAHRREIHERLARGGAGRAAAFVEAVVVQAAFPLGLDAPPEGWAARERDVAAAALHLLLEAGTIAGRAGDGAAARLRDDPPLLAAFFQNVDLLYRHAHPGADDVSALVMRALEMLDEEEDGAGTSPAPAT